MLEALRVRIISGFIYRFVAIVKKEGEIDEKMSHYDVMVKNLIEQNRALQHEILQLHNEKLALTNQLKYLKKLQSVIKTK